MWSRIRPQMKGTLALFVGSEREREREENRDYKIKQEKGEIDFKNELYGLTKEC